MKRHDVIRYMKDEGFYPHRVHIIHVDHVLAIDTMGTYKWYPIEDCEVVDYKGCVNYGRYYRMPTLRNLRNKTYGYRMQKTQIQNPELVEELYGLVYP